MASSSRKFKFISPGIFINEIDRSQVAGLPNAVGPAIIGRFERGPALTPVQINSAEELAETFGNPIAGGLTGDIFRNGNYTAPTYAAYAAQAWLRNSSPVTIVRLLGDTNKEASSEAAYAGWKTTNTALTSAQDEQGGAFGLFVASHPALENTVTFNLEDGVYQISASFTGSDTYMLTASAAAPGDDASTGAQYGFHTASTNAGIASNFATAVNLHTSGTGISAAASSNVVTLTYTGVDAALMITASDGDAVVLKDRAGTTITNNTMTILSSSLTGLTGTLAAVWYINKGSISLSGTMTDVSASATASAGMFLRPVEDGTFKAVIQDENGTQTEATAFNFTSTSAKYIRKRFNTSPIKTNSTITSNTTNYWLGETYEGCLKQKVLDTTSAKERLFGAIMPLSSPDGSTIIGSDFKKSYSAISRGDNVIPKTGWFISQDISGDYDNFEPEEMEKLFRLVGHQTREEGQRKIKISIKDIRKSNDPNSDYGTFTVAVRDMQDTDDNPVYLEQFNNCNLNRASDNFISKKIGDKWQEWDYDSKLYREYGDYPNVSKYIRVKLHDNVKLGEADASLLPFGVFGPPTYNPFMIDGNATWRDGTGGNLETTDGSSIGNVTTGTFVYHDSDYAGATENTDKPIVSTGSILTQFDFPKLRLRMSSSEGFLQDPTDAFWGVDTTYNSNVFDQSVRDVLRAKPDTINSHDSDGNYTTASFVFTLDNIRNVDATSSGYTGSLSINAVYDENSRKNRTSYTVLSGATGGDATPSYETVLDAGFDKFTTCMHGGWDGLDITEREPFRNTGLSGQSATSNYAYNSIEMAIDTLRDPERVECNLVAMPGITNDTLNSKLVRQAEQRGDCIAIIDPAGGYVPDTENTSDVQDRLGSVNAVVNTVSQNLRLNSSYGACYYPWVQIRDNINGATLWAPPSVVAIGALAYSEAVSELWFAPAGFTRGGLSTNSAAGIPVVGVRQRLTSKERDKLYENNVNPIASFPAEGIVIFGQKTLQTSPSALDRINVRRLVIFLKREVSRIAATLLFDQNVQVTWNRFRGQAESLLGSVKSGLGLSDYKVVLDQSTTTPDLIDRNILYAKIFIKPARAIEFIAIDFIITDSGASFED